MCEFTGCPGALQLESAKPHPATERPHLATSTGRPRLLTGTEPHPSVTAGQPSKSVSTTERFKFASEQELTELAKGLVPENTSKSSKWALNNFEAWLKARNASDSDIHIPENILMSTDPEVISTHLSRFIVETRKSNGELYPPSTLYQLLCGLLRYMRDHNPGCPNFLDKKDSRFRHFQGTLDAYFHKLHSEGVGRHTRHAETISSDEENQLWETGVLNTSTPKGLQNAVFYVIGKTFCLRGGQEHRVLKLSQLQRDSDKYTCIYENVSKNRNGSFKQLHLKGKVVPVFPCQEARERCPVHLLDLYSSKLPEEAKKNDLFYVRPLEKKPIDPGKPWLLFHLASTLCSRRSNGCVQRQELVDTKATTA